MATGIPVTPGPSRTDGFPDGRRDPRVTRVHVALMTREYPPEVYGGAGVHVDFLARHLAPRVRLDVHCMGAPREGAFTYGPPPGLPAGVNPALGWVGADVAMAAGVVEAGADLVHSHTWYANLAGLLAGQTLGVPHVVTAHSLEPSRPWKAEQLGGGYRVSSWAERSGFEAASAVIAVSDGMRAEVLAAYPAIDPRRVHVVRNGIDTDLYRAPAPDDPAAVAVRAGLGIDPGRPYVCFVGRITRQKGVPHLLRAALDFDPAIQVVLLAGAADTPELAAETDAAIATLQARRTGVIVFSTMLARPDVVAVLSAAAVFVCPSVYEPLGIVNLEAMACAIPVVASAVGGIPEVVDDGRTGVLVPYDEAEPVAFEAALARAVNGVVGHPAAAAAMGRAGRERAVTEFGWDRIADQTVAVYRAAGAA